MKPAILFLAVLLGGCASVPGRFVQPAGTVSFEVSLSGAYLDQMKGLDALPIPANLALGMKYGLADRVDLGLRMYPMPLFLGTLVIDPSVAWNWAGHQTTSQWNSFLSAPVELNLRSWNLTLEPQTGMTFVRAWGSGSAYVNLGVQTNSDEWLQGSPSVHMATQWGGRYVDSNALAYGLELGLLRIGEYSIASPLSRAQIGVPTVALGLEWDPREGGH